MTSAAVPAVPKTHKIGKPIMLTQSDIDKRRADLEKKYGSVAVLRQKKRMGVLSTDEFMALLKFDDLDYLEGK